MAVQPKRILHETSIIRTKIGGSKVSNSKTWRIQIMDCHMMVEVNKAFLPKSRKRTVGEALMKASTIGFERPVQSELVARVGQKPLGLMAGARATNKLTFSFN